MMAEGCTLLKIDARTSINVRQIVWVREDPECITLFMASAGPNGKNYVVVTDRAVRAALDALRAGK